MKYNTSVKNSKNEQINMESQNVNKDLFDF